MDKHFIEILFDSFIINYENENKISLAENREGVFF